MTAKHHGSDSEVDLVLVAVGKINLVQGPGDKVDLVHGRDDEVDLVHGPNDDVDLDEADLLEGRKPRRVQGSLFFY